MVPGAQKLRGADGQTREDWTLPDFGYHDAALLRNQTKALDCGVSAQHPCRYDPAMQTKRGD